MTAYSRNCGPSATPQFQLCLGGNRLGGELDQEESFRLLDRFVELGGTLIDTAHVYADWLPGNERSSSERVLGRWRASRGIGPDIEIGTKGGHPDVATPTVKRISKRDLRVDVLAALENLGLEVLPLFYLHRDDAAQEVSTILAWLEGFVAEGLIERYAACNWTPGRLGAAVRVAAEHGWSGFSVHQAGFSLAVPGAGKLSADLVTVDAEVLALHQAAQVPLIAYSAQAKGFFDKIAADPASVRGGTYDTELNRRAAAVVQEVAGELRCTPTQVAVAAITMLPVPTVAVIGPRTVDQLESSWRSLQIEFTDRQRNRLAGLVQRNLAADQQTNSALL